MPKEGDDLLVYLHHTAEEARLPGVLKEMEKMGAPRVRVFERENRFYVTDGVHRLTAAKQLGILPHFLVVGEDLTDRTYREPLLDDDSPTFDTTVGSTVESAQRHVEEHKDELHPLSFSADCPRTYAEHCAKCLRLFFPPETCGCQTLA